MSNKITNQMNKTAPAAVPGQKMTADQAFQILQMLINGAIKGGIFNNAQGVVNAQNALIRLQEIFATDIAPVNHNKNGEAAG